MKAKKLSKKLVINKVTINNLDNDNMNRVRAGYHLDSVYICSVPGSDCYCGTRPPKCTDKYACWY